MRMNSILMALTALGALGSPLSDAMACTTFLAAAGEQVRIGKSYDWHQGHGLVVVNKRGLAKRALVLEPGATAAQWTSKYASLTFNQYGREMPNGGMNTEGLVVEVMWLRASEYPPADARPTVNELQWIQYQLDNFATTAQVIAAAPRMRVASIYARVHYLVCDRSAQCAAVEYVDGKLAIATGKEVRALTNDTWERSMGWLKSGRGAGQRRTSLRRFGTAWDRTKAMPRSDEATCFEVLDAVDQGEYTQWGIVWDPKALTVSWRTREAPEPKRTRLSAFEPSCREAARVLDANVAAGGDRTEDFEAYTPGANRALLEKTTRRVAKHLPPGAVWLLSAYPDSATCTELGALSPAR